MVEVEERRLGALEEEVVAGRQGLVQQPHRVDDAGGQPGAELAELLDDLVDVERRTARGLDLAVLGDGAVALGSGVSVRGELIKQGEGAGLGSAMVCIADGRIVAGFNGGGLVRLTEGRYHTDATEVFASFRSINGIPQYVAIPR